MRLEVWNFQPDPLDVSLNLGTKQDGKFTLVAGFLITPNLRVCKNCENPEDVCARTCMHVSTCMHASWQRGSDGAQIVTPQAFLLLVRLSPFPNAGPLPLPLSIHINQGSL